MSKAFDTVSRPKLLKYLKEILADCEIHMIEILIKDMTLNVKIGQNTGDDINTELCLCDCLSAIFFIFYLCKSIKPMPNEVTEDDHRDLLLYFRLGNKAR